MLPREAVPAGPVVLRPLADDDTGAILRACADPEIVRFIPTIPAPYTADDARLFVTETAPGMWDAGGANFAIADPATGGWLGGISLKAPDVRGNVEIGYMVAPWARGRGVASAAARALTEWAFRQGTHRVELVTDLENVASQRVAMAAGFRREGLQRGAGPLRDGGRDDLVPFARLATDSGEPQRSFLPDLPGGSLSDGVVRLAPITPADAGAYQAMMEEPEVLIRSVPPQAPDPDDTARRLRCTGMWWLSGERAELSVRDAGTGEFAGHIQLMNIVPPLGQAMIGYSLARRFRGRGFMTRAVDLLCEWAFASTPLYRIVAGTAPDNVPSHRVLERAGFTQEAVIKSLLPGLDGTRHDDLQWVRLRG
ncbi:GNAT family N-acetyltransferase [Sphaerisporangium perillae]|uniref:GNAT family N-acetyltransferase n=1 Tax=Sphaerisporangium perillae TaxID=2935860 RepID=UPI0020102BAB|nr:GNAT family N-acetyltransferase [Sphaerisporangium perillae]